MVEKGRYAGSDDKPQGGMAMPPKRKRLLVGKGKFTVSFDGASSVRCHPYSNNKR